MGRPSNQSIERYYFEQFRLHYKLPDGEVQYSDKPDVIIRGAAMVGIEIANLYISSGNDPTSEQVQRSRRAQVLERAQSLHAARGGKRIELSVDFQPDQPILEVAPVAQPLAELACAVEDGPSGLIKPKLFKHVPQLRSVYCNASEHDAPWWRAVQCYTVPYLSTERLRDVIQSKSGKAKSYQACDEYWLLLIVDFADRAQDQELQRPVAAPLEKSAFRRVLIYKPQFAQVLEVAT